MTWVTVDEPHKYDYSQGQNLPEIQGDQHNTFSILSSARNVESSDLPMLY